jgi:hypothetical protein
MSGKGYNDALFSSGLEKETTLTTTPLVRSVESSTEKRSGPPDFGFDAEGDGPLWFLGEPYGASWPLMTSTGSGPIET